MAALERFRAAMDDDLDTPRATAQLFELVTLANSLADGGDQARAAELAAAVLEMASALGLPLGTTPAVVDHAASSLASERDEARRRKDYARADALRAELQAQGWIVEDTPDGTTIRR
jgi:cysteinyl-tRNA synthetase